MIFLRINASIVFKIKSTNGFAKIAIKREKKFFLIVFLLCFYGGGGVLGVVM